MNTIARPRVSHAPRAIPARGQGEGARPMTVRPVPAVKRSIEIRFHLAKAEKSHGVSRIARDLGILPSSCLHILRELVAGGLARFDAERKTYSLGPGILTLSRAVHDRDAMVELAQKHIDRKSVV